MPSTNDTKNMFLEILLNPNIMHSKDNEICLKTFPSLDKLNSLLTVHIILV